MPQAALALAELLRLDNSVLLLEVGLQPCDQPVEGRAAASIGAHIFVHRQPGRQLQPNASGRRARGRGPARQRDLADADAEAGPDRRQLREVAVGAQRELVAASFGMRPSAADRGVSRSNPITAWRRALREPRGATPFEVAPVGVQPDRICRGASPPALLAGLTMRTAMSASRRSRSSTSFDRASSTPARDARAQRREDRRQHLGAHDLARGHAHRAPHRLAHRGCAQESPGGRGQRLGVGRRARAPPRWPTVPAESGRRAATRAAAPGRRRGGRSSAASARARAPRPTTNPPGGPPERFGRGPSSARGPYRMYIDQTDIVNSVYRRRGHSGAPHQHGEDHERDETALVLGATGGIGGEIARR